MSPRYAINWSLWIAFFTGLYVLCYTLSPLYEMQTLPCTFIALPIYFSMGAKKEHYADYLSSAAIGVLWAIVSINLISTLIVLGWNDAFATSFIVFVISIALCATHFMLAGKKLFTRIPMIFGAIASTFIFGVDKWPYVLATLTFGITLAYICQLGTQFISETGHFKFTGKKELPGS